MSRLENQTFGIRAPRDDVEVLHGGAGGALAEVVERRAIGIVSSPLRLVHSGEPLALMPYGILR